MDLRTVQLLLLVVGAVNTLLLVSALLLRKENPLANRLLAYITLGFLYTQTIFTLEFIGLSLPRGMVRTPFMVNLSVISALYAYVQAMTIPNYRLRLSRPVFLVPVLFGVAWYLSLLLFASDEAFWRAGETLNRERYLRSLVIVITLGAFLVLCLRQIEDFEKRLKDYYSNLEKLRLFWIKCVIGLFGILFGVGVLDILSGPEVAVWNLFPAINTMAVLLFDGLALRQSMYFLKDLPPEKNGDMPSKAVVLPTDKLETHRRRLRELLDQRKLYLNSELRLVDLAAELGLKPHEVSALIRQGFQSSFYELINSERVEEAKRRLRDPQFAHMNILGIATDCGFNSKSVFNDTFKRMVGTTPSGFRSLETSH